MRFVVARLLPCLLVVGLSGACRGYPAWTPRSTPPCLVSTGDPELDRERTYLAVLLALQSRHYAIVYAEAPRQIEAEFASDYKPDRSNTRWLLSVQPDASLLIDTPSNQRQTHEKTESWYDKLNYSTRQLQCRELNWLRWEAQNRGLIGVGAAMAATGQVDPGVGEVPAGVAAGGEVPAGAAARGGGAASANQTLVPGSAAGGGAQGTAAPLAVASGAANGPALHAATAARLAQLEERRASLHTGRAITWSAVGLGVTTAGYALLWAGILNVSSECDNSTELYDIDADCETDEIGRSMAIGGGAVLAAGGVMLAISLPRLFSKLRESRRLNREIKLLRSMRLSPGAPLGGVGMMLGGSF